MRGTWQWPEVPTQEHDMEVLTRELGSGLEALTREHKFGLDAQVPHEAWFCGLKQCDKVACVGTYGLCHANGEGAVVSSDLCAPVGKRICMVRANNWFDFRNELSVEHRVEPFLSYLRPLFVWYFKVLAEIPDSVRQHSPLSTRNMECTFLHLGLKGDQLFKGSFALMERLN